MPIYNNDHSASVRSLDNKVTKSPFLSERAFYFSLFESDVNCDRAVRHNKLRLTRHVIDDFLLVAKDICNGDGL